MPLSHNNVGPGNNANMSITTGVIAIVFESFGMAKCSVETKGTESLMFPLGVDKTMRNDCGGEQGCGDKKFGPLEKGEYWGSDDVAGYTSKDRWQRWAADGVMWRGQRRGGLTMGILMARLSRLVIGSLH
eukprot:14238816-Ditylum_brightwellii.AAC.1